MAIRKRTWTSGKGEQTAWVVDYKDQNGKRRLKTFTKQKDAKDWWEGQAAYEVKQGTHTPASASITVAEAAENWIKRAELEGRERSTVDQYRQHVEYHIVPLVGNLKLAELTAPGMEALRDRLLQTLSRPMAKKVLTSLKSILREAQRRGHVAQNAAAGVSIRTEARHKRKLQVGVDIPSKQEIQQILQKVEGRWRPLLVTAIFTGLRASELRGLSWGDVDFDSKAIHIRQRADRYNQIGSPKSGAGERDVPMSPMVLNTLKEWKLACPKGNLDLVFPNGRGNVEGLPNIYRRGFGGVQEACGIVTEDGKPKYGMHALRHFFASWMIDQGFPPKRVQTILGHSSIQMTYDVYGHLFPSEKDDYEKLAAGELELVG